VRGLLPGGGDPDSVVVAELVTSPIGEMSIAAA